MAKSKTVEEDLDDNLIWDSQKVAEAVLMVQSGSELKRHPFYDKKDPDWKRAGLNYRFSMEELEELVKCKNDIVYYANNYVYSQTEGGVERLVLRDYQEDILKRLAENRFVVWLAARQIGKCHLLSSLTIKDNGIEDKKNIEILYYQSKAKIKSLTFLEKIKLFLYKIIQKLK